MDWTTMGIVFVLLIIAIVGMVYLRRVRRANGAIPEGRNQYSEHKCSGCCGGTSCFNAGIGTPPRVVYFEDEELDRFRNRKGEDYTQGDVEEWLEVLKTLRKEELAPWQRSIRLRHLSMPPKVEEELRRMLKE